MSECAQVLFHYSAFFEFADEPFDSTFLRNKAQKVSLGADETLPGLKIALRTMRKRERSRFLVRADYAFGEMGCPPRIPTGATILYEVTLVDVITNFTTKDFDELEYTQQKNASFQERFDAAKVYHRQVCDYILFLTYSTVYNTIVMVFSFDLISPHEICESRSLI